MSINPAPQGIENVIEVFGSYNGSEKALNDEMKYNFHLWVEKENQNTLAGRVYLPFTCTTENQLFCIFKSETETEEGGL